MQEIKIKISDLEVSFKTFGDKLLVLVLHGWGVGSEAWVATAEGLAAEGYRVICPDMPGFGKSQMPDRPWEFDDYIGWVEQFVKEQKLEKFILIGHSFGGALATKFAAIHPEMVEKLVLCAAAGIRRERLGLRQKIAKFLARGKGILKKSALGNKLYPWLRKIVYKIAGVQDYAQARGVMAQTFKNVIKRDTLKYAQEIKMPTLIVWGGQDKETPLGDAYEINGAIAGSRLEIIKGAGHKLHRTHTAEVVKNIARFVG